MIELTRNKQNALNNNQQNGLCKKSSEQTMPKKQLYPGKQHRSPRRSSHHKGKQNHCVRIPNNENLICLEKPAPWLKSGDLRNNT
jgi:hypothetical protein